MHTWQTGADNEVVVEVVALVTEMVVELRSMVNKFKNYMKFIINYNFFHMKKYTLK